MVGVTYLGWVLLTEAMPLLWVPHRFPLAIYISLGALLPL
jgi:hypothetical protein